MTAISRKTGVMERFHGVARVLLLSEVVRRLDPAQTAAEGALLVVAGEPSVYNDRLQFTHPDLLTVDPAAERTEDEPCGMGRRLR